MGQTVKLKADDGHQLDAYRANPAGRPGGRPVTIQEIFGDNGHIRRVTDGYAADGYVALAPALFDRIEPGIEMGYQQADIDQGRPPRGKLCWDTMGLCRCAA